VLAGEVADKPGVLFGPDSAFFVPPIVDPSWPNETLAATDALPFVDLGSFAANEANRSASCSPIRSATAVHATSSSVAGRRYKKIP
jgi:hypothetical protein